MIQPKEAYFDKASGWAFSQEKSLRASRKLAWIIAAVAVAAAVAEAFALAALAPLKTVTPIPILVDRQTGFVQTLKADGRSEIRADASLTQSLIAQYVLGRESFNIASVSSDYRKVMLWSAGDVQSEYAAALQRQNPQSPLRIYPRTTTIEAKIASVSSLSPQVYLVRFTTARIDAGAKPSSPRHWAAIVSFRYIDAPMKLEDRLTNPLGFQVIRYHRDEESVPPEMAPAVPADEKATEPTASPDKTAPAVPHP